MKYCGHMTFPSKSYGILLQSISHSIDLIQNGLPFFQERLLINGNWRLVLANIFWTLYLINGVRGSSLNISFSLCTSQQKNTEEETVAKRV